MKRDYTRVQLPAPGPWTEWRSDLLHSNSVAEDPLRNGRGVGHGTIRAFNDVIPSGGWCDVEGSTNSRIVTVRSAAGHRLLDEGPREARFAPGKLRGRGIYIGERPITTVEWESVLMWRVRLSGLDVLKKDLPPDVIARGPHVAITTEEALFTTGAYLFFWEYQKVGKFGKGPPPACGSDHATYMKESGQLVQAWLTRKDASDRFESEIRASLGSAVFSEEGKKDFFFCESHKVAEAAARLATVRMTNGGYGVEDPRPLRAWSQRFIREADKRKQARHALVTELA